MTQHRAPTAVTIAPTTESSGVAEWVQKYWLAATIAAVAATGLIIYWQYSKISERAAEDQSWEKLTRIASPDPTTGILTGPFDELRTVESELKGTRAGPWALYIAANSALAKRETSEALALVARLKSEYPSHPLVTELYPFDGQGPATSQADALEMRIRETGAWVEGHATLFKNPELPPDAPRVRLSTDRGPIVVGLYADRAPKHVENFLKLVREGYYTGTKFHAVVKGSLIQTGDPNSVTGDPSTWGKGGPDHKIEFEENDLKHFAGFLTALNEPNTQSSSGSQFSITTGDVHGLAGQAVVFGKVLEGMDIVSQIEMGSVVDGTNRPADPVSIQSAEVL